MKKKLFKSLFALALTCMLSLGMLPGNIATDAGLVMEVQAESYNMFEPLAGRFDVEGLVKVTSAEVNENEYGNLVGRLCFELYDAAKLNTTFAIWEYGNEENASGTNEVVDGSYMVTLPLEVEKNDNGQVVNSIKVFFEITDLEGKTVVFHEFMFPGFGPSVDDTPCTPSTPCTPTQPEPVQVTETKSEPTPEPQTAENNYNVFQEETIKNVEKAIAEATTAAANAAVSASGAASTNTPIAIDTGVWISFKGNVYQKLQDSGLPVQISFMYKGERYRVDIPAGADLMSLVDENGYCGFLNLMAHFGGTKL